MTATNPHPLANPLNSYKYAAYEMRCSSSVVSHCDDPSKLQVPDSSVSYEQAQAMAQARQNLTVPCSAPDDLCTGSSAGFIGQTSLFRLHDGSVLDLKAHKVVFDPNAKFKAAGCWNDPNDSIERSITGEWGKAEPIALLLAQYDACNGNYDPNISPESANYWRRAKEESKKLEQSMTDEQQELLKSLETEQFFPMTRLEEEK